MMAVIVTMTVTVVVAVTMAKTRTTTSKLENFGAVGNRGPDEKIQIAKVCVISQSSSNI